MRIVHSNTTGCNFIEVNFYPIKNEMYFFGYTFLSNIFKDEYSIGIWRVKYKNNEDVFR